MIQGFLYDLDGTLLDTERLHDQSWKQALLQNGAIINDEFYARTMGTNARNVKNVIRELYGLDGDRLYELEKELTWNHMVEHGVPVLPGVREALSFYKAQGRKQCVCTSTNRGEATKWLERAGLLSAFDAVVCGDDLHKSKPDPEIFLLGAKKLGLDVKDCLVIEDSLNGLLAGLASGAYVARVDGTREIPEAIRAKTHYLPSFVDLPALAEQWGSTSQA